MPEMTAIEKYYNKFNEEKRLDSRHGRVEFNTSIKYIHDYIYECKKKYSCENCDIKILDIGAGTGRYSVYLANEGYDVSAVELVKHNLGLLKAKNSNVKARQGNALNLKYYNDDSFDITLLFGPMYHLFAYEDKVRAMNEAKRVTKPGGVIFTAYVMNEYGVITYAFKQKNIKDVIRNKRLTSDFHTISYEEDLYDYVRIEDINKINMECGLERIKIISPDGPADYMRPFLNSLDDEEFEMFLEYQLSICERQDLIGAGAHTVDILRKQLQ